MSPGRTGQGDCGAAARAAAITLIAGFAMTVGLGGGPPPATRRVQ